MRGGAGSNIRIQIVRLVFKDYNAYLSLLLGQGRKKDCQIPEI